MKKPMLEVSELIQHMKNKGIGFTIISDEEATRHLSAHNNYFKLTSYRKNYTKYTSGSKKGQYERLEFAYLRELAQIDTEIRHILLDMALDIEHFLKVALIKAVEDRKAPNEEDGYQIVVDYKNDVGNETDPDHFKKVNFRSTKYIQAITQGRKNPYCENLTAKYSGDMPIWVFVELISFGDLEELIGYYASKTGWNIPVDMKSISRVRQIRNACAHGNAIIYDLNPCSKKNGRSVAPLYISQYVYQAGISRTTAQKKLSNPRISQIVHLLYVYDHLVTSQHTRNMRLAQLRELVNNRCLQNKTYFEDNPLLTTTHDFFVKLVAAIENK